MIHVEVDRQVSGFDGVVTITSDLPPLAAFRSLFTFEEWRQFTRAVKGGAYDLDESNRLPTWNYT
jgi:hypothetical protein